MLVIKKITHAWINVTHQHHVSDHQMTNVIISLCLNVASGNQTLTFIKAWL